MSVQKVMGVGVREAAKPEFQVVRERGRDRKGREGSRDGTRDAVSSLESGKGMLGGWSVFDLRSRGLI